MLRATVLLVAVIVAGCASPVVDEERILRGTFALSEFRYCTLGSRETECVSLADTLPGSGLVLTFDDRYVVRGQGALRFRRWPGYEATGVYELLDDQEFEGRYLFVVSNSFEMWFTTEAGGETFLAAVRSWMYGFGKGQVEVVYHDWPPDPVSSLCIVLTRAVAR